MGKKFANFNKFYNGYERTENYDIFSHSPFGTSHVGRRLPSVVYIRLWVPGYWLYL